MCALQALSERQFLLGLISLGEDSITFLVKGSSDSVYRVSMEIKEKRRPQSTTIVAVGCTCPDHRNRGR